MGAARNKGCAATSFLRYGLEHVLHGLDHLLFVLCLALGAAGLSGLIWRVTGFTAGHAVSLGAGFFGYAPHQSWFIPAVETAIALSILLAATSLLFRRTGLRIVMALTIAVGLIHGLRFSFVLRDLLDTHGPPVIPSFAAFNLGVEAGQSIFAAAVFGIAAWIAHRSQPGHRRLQIAAALCCAVVALIWTFERGQALLI